MIAAGTLASAEHLVIFADYDDLDALAQVIADAISRLAVAQWLIPCEAERARVLPGYGRILVDHALGEGMVLTTPARDAAALWLPVGQAGPLAPRDYDARLEAATRPWATRFRMLDDALDKHHPLGVPHHHLAALAVRPDRQHAGIGTALLAHHHELMDRTGTPAYLEASDRGTRRIYLSFGYRDYMDGPIQLHDGPQMHPMWREPGQSPQENR